MSEDALAREVVRLCADFGLPGNSNVWFVSERLVGLLGAGHRLADIESELRRRDAPIFLAGLPLHGALTRHVALMHPDKSVDDGQLRFRLWIGINGPEEVDRVLAEESISAAANLANLGTTGLMVRRDLPEDPTARDLMDWLAGDMTWAERASMIRRHLDVLRTAEALDALASRAPAIGDLVLHATRDGIRLAFQNCRPLVSEALRAFVHALTWAAAGAVYREREDELSGDLAQEILLTAARQRWLTAAQRAVIDAHVQTLEVAWERGIEAAIELAERDFPAKAGTPAAEDYLQAYLNVPDLEAAREMLRAAPPELFQIDDDALAEGLRRADNGDDLWRIGMFHDARERGPDAAYHDWAELAATEALDDDAAVERLTVLAERHRGCLRDRTLELLSNRYLRTGDLDARRAVMQELVDHRSADSPPGQRVFDLGNLGQILGEQGELETARTRMREALALITSVRGQAQRGLVWARAGSFYRVRGDDLPMAVHSFRVAVEEFRSTGDLASEAFALEQLSAIYRKMLRADLAVVYATLAHHAVTAWDGQRPGLAVYGDVTFLVEGGLAQSEFLLNDFAAAARRLKRLLGPPRQAADGERVSLERVALAAAVASGDRDFARGILATWAAARGFEDWVALGQALITANDILARDPSRALTPAQVPELAGLGDTLVRLGVPRPDAESFLSEQALDRVAPALLHSLAGISDASPVVNTRLVSEYDDLAMSTRAERAAALLTPAPRRGAVADAGTGADAALPPGASWPEVIARYHDLDVWELPDLAILGAVLDRWSLRSRFGGAVLINPPRPREGCLNFYFYRSDPERHLGGEHTCTYIPADDLVVCSLPYLDSMFRLEDAAADAAEITDRDDDAETLAMALRGYERILVEWIIAHEIGHAHLGHATASSADEALDLEEAADSFFLDGILADASAAVITLAFYSLLNRLYSYDCQRQFHRTVSPSDLLDHPLVLDATPDETGHRPLVFRAVSLVKSILRTRPDIEDSTYIDRFAASLEGRGEKAG